MGMRTIGGPTKAATEESEQMRSALQRVGVKN